MNKIFQNARVIVLAAAAALAAFATPCAPAVAGVWSADVSGDWSNPLNWSGGFVPGTSPADVAYLTAYANSDITVTLDTDQTVGFLALGDPNGAYKYTLAGSGGHVLTLDNTGGFGPAQIVQSTNSVGDEISANLALKSSLNLDNTSLSNLLTVSSQITSSATSGTQTIANATVAGQGVLLSGNIADGGTGGKIAIAQSAEGSWLTLSGTNTFSGGVTLNSGTLNLNSAKALGGSTGIFTINGGTLDSTAVFPSQVLTGGNTQTWNADFTFAGTQGLHMGGAAVSLGTAASVRTVTVAANTLTVGGNISNGSATGLSKAGPGTLLLSGISSFSVPMTITAGTLEIGGAGKLQNGAYSGAISINSSALLKFSTSSSQTLSGVVSGGGGLTWAGSGALTLTNTNTFAGPLLVKGGTVSFGSFNDGGNGTLGFGNTAAPSLVLDGGALSWTADTSAGTNRLFTLGPGGGALLQNHNSQAINWSNTAAIAFTGSGARNLTFGGSSLYFTNGTAGTGFNPAIGDGPGGATRVTKIGAGSAWSLNGANSYSGLTDVQAGLLVLSKQASLKGGIAAFTPGNIKVAPGAALAVSAGSPGAGYFDAPAIAAVLGNLGPSTPTTGLMPGGQFGLDTTNAPNQTFSYGSVLADLSGGNALNFAKVGSGTLLLTGANTYTGTTNLYPGAYRNQWSILQAGNAQAFGPAATASLNFVNAAAQSLSKVQLNGFDITVVGLNSANAGGGAGYVESGSAAPGTDTLTVNNTAANSFAGILQDGSTRKLALTKDGSGTLTLGGNNTYTGGTLIRNGVLQGGAGTSLGNGPVSFAAGVTSSVKLQLNNSDLTISGGLSTDAGTPGSPIVENGGANAKTLTINSAAPGVSTFAGILQNGGGGALGLTKSGTGLQVLSGTNTYTGNTLVNGGGLLFDSTASVPNGIAASNRNVTITAPGTLGFTANFGAANIPGALLNRIATGSSGTIAADNNAATNFNFQTAGLSAASLGAIGNATYTGTLTPNGTTYRLGGGGGMLTLSQANALTGGGNSLVVGGGGVTASTVVLSNANNFGGSTTVSGGTLAITNSAALGAGLGNLTVSGGVLDLGGTTGLSAGVVSISSGGIQNGTLTGTSYATSGGMVTARLAGPGAVLTNNGGTTILNAANTYGGGTNLTGGTLKAYAAGSLGTGTVTLSAGDLQLLNNGNGSGSPQTISYGNTVSVTGNRTITVDRVDTSAGNAANKTLQLGTLLLGNNNNLTVVNNNGYGLEFTGAANLTGVPPTITVGGGSSAPVVPGLRLSGVVSGAGLVKAGAGTLVLTNSGNTFGASATLTINAGLLSGTAVGVFGDNEIISLNAAGAGLQADGTFAIVNQISTAAAGGLIDVTQGNTLTLNTTPLNGGAASSNGFTKTGNGIFAINANNNGAAPYAGAITVNAGAIRVSDPGALGAAANNTVVANTVGAAVQLNGVTTNELFTINNTGINSGGALEALASGAPSTLGGAITLGSAATIGADNGATLNIAAAISGASDLTFASYGSGNINLNTAITTGVNSLAKIGSGTLTFAVDNSTSTLVNNQSFSINAGTVVLSDAGKTYKTQGSGAIQVNPAAVLTLNNTASSVADRLAGQPLKLGGATLNFIANGSTNETVGALTINSGFSTINASNTSSGGTLTFVSLARNAGGALNFSSLNSSAIQFTAAPGLTGNIMGGAYFVGNDFATYSGSGPYSVAAYSAYTTGDLGVTGGTADNMKPTGSQSAVNTKTINSLNLATTGVTINPFQALTLGTGGLINSVSGNSINGGFLTALASKELSVNSASGASLAINSVIVNDGSYFYGVQGGNGLIKTGAGSVTLGNPMRTGNVYVNQGTLTLGNGNNTLKYGEWAQVNSGGTLQLSAATQTLARLTNSVWDNTNPGIEGAGGTVTSAAGGTLIVAPDTGGTAFGGSFQGNLNLVKSGGNNWILSAASTTSGTTSVLGGTLVLTSGGALGTAATPSGGIAIGPGAVLTLENNGALTNSVYGTKDLADRISDATAITLNAGTINYRGRANFNSTETLGDSTHPVTLNSGLSTLIVDNNGTGVNSATLTLASLTRSPGAMVAFDGRTNGGSNWNLGQIGNNPRLLITAAPTLVNGILPGAFYVNADQARPRFVSYTSGLGIGSMDTGGFPASVATLSTAAATDNVWWAADNQTQNVRPGGQTVNSLNLQWHSSARFTGASDILTLAGGMLTLGTDQPDNANFYGAVGTPTVRGVLTSNTPELFVYSGRSGTINSVIQGSNSLVVGSINAVRLTAPNTYTGGTYVNSGTLELRGTLPGVRTVPAATNPANSLVITNSAVNMQNYAGQIAPASQVTLNGSGTLNLLGNNTLSQLTFNSNGGGNPTVNTSGVLTLTGDIVSNPANVAATPYIGGTLDLNGSAAHTITVADVPGLQRSYNTTGLKIEALIQDGGFTKSGSGNLWLNQNNTFTGGLTISQGSVHASQPYALGGPTNVVTLAGGGQVWVDVYLNNDPYYGNNRGGVGTLANTMIVASGGGTLAPYYSQIGNQNDWRFTRGFSVGTIQLNDTLTATVVDPSQNAVDNSLVINGRLTGAGGLLVTGSLNDVAQGQLVNGQGNVPTGQVAVIALGGSGNDYTGGTTISASGRLQMNQPQPSGYALLGNVNNALTINPGGTLDLNGSIQAVGSLNGAASAVGGIVGGGTLSVGMGGASGNFQGILGGSFTLVKSGAGAQVLGGKNTSSGATKVDGGVLRLDYSTNDTSKLADGNTLIFSGGTLDLSGGSHSELIYTANGQGGSLAAGASAVTRSGGSATLHLNTLSRAAGSTIDFSAANLAYANTNANITYGTTAVTNGILGVRFPTIQVATTTGNPNPSGAPGGWATVGGTDWATAATGNADSPIVAYTAYTDITPTGSAINDGRTTNVRLFGSGPAGNITVGTSPIVNVNTLLQSTATPAVVNVGGTTLQTNAIMIAAGQGNLTVAGNPGGGKLTASAEFYWTNPPNNAPNYNNGNTNSAMTSPELVLINNNAASTLAISASIANANVLNTLQGGYVTAASALTTSGTGLITLSAANTYTGTTTVAGGTLGLSGSGTLGATTAPLTLAGGALNLGGTTQTVGAVSLLDAAASGDTIANGNLLGASYTFSNVAGNAVISARLGGAGGLLKTDNGTLTLSAANSYTGGTTVGGTNGFSANAFNGGTLQLTGLGTLGSQTAPGALVVNGGLVELGGTTQNITRLALGGGNAATTSKIAIGSGGALNLGGNVSYENQGAAGAQLTGAGTLNLNGTRYFAISASGNSAYMDLTVACDIANGGSGSGGIVKTYNGTLVFSGPAKSYTGGTAISGGTLQIGTALAAGNLSGNVLDNANLAFFTGNGAQSDTSVISGAGSVTKLGKDALTLNGANTYTGGTMLSGGALKVGTGTLGDSRGLVTVNPAAVLDLNDHDLSVSLLAGSALWPVGSGGTIVNDGSTAKTLTIGGVNFGGAGRGDLNNNDFRYVGGKGGAAGSARFSGVIADNNNGGSGQIAVVKAGNGAMAMTGANTYTGTTTINAGLLTAAIGEQVVYGPFGQSPLVNPGSIVFGGGTLQYSNANATDYSGRFSTAGGQPISIDTNNQTVTFATPIQGTGTSLAKMGSGTLVLGAANTYTGNTYLLGSSYGEGGGDGNVSGSGYGGGALQANVAELPGVSGPFGRQSANAVGTIVFGGGMLQYTANNQADYSGRFVTSGGQPISIDTNGQTVTFATPIQGPGTTVTKFGAGTLSLTGANTHTGWTVIAGGSLQLGNNGTDGTLAGDVVNRGTLVYNVLGDQAAAGRILGTGTVTKIGGGTQTLSGANVYTGATIVSDGTLKAGIATQAFGVNSAVTVDKTLDLNGFNETIGSLASALGGGSVLLGGNTLTTGTNGTSTSYWGTLSGTGGGLSKVGAGQLTLNSYTPNTYTGATAVNGGTLQLDFANLSTTTDLINSSSPLSLGGGAVVVKGKYAGTTSQTFNGLTVNAFGGQVLGNVNGGAGTTIHLEQMVATAAGGSLLIGVNGQSDTTGLVITTTSDVGSTEVCGGRVVFFNGSANTGYDWATTSSFESPYRLEPFVGYWPLSSLTGEDTLNSRVVASQSLSGSPVTNTLKIEAPSAGQSLAVGGNRMTLTSGGLLVTGTNAFAITGDAGDTRLTAGNGSGTYDLIVHQYNTGGLTISAVVGDNAVGGTHPVALVKAGSQALVLSGLNTYSGGTYLNGGTLTAQAATQNTTWATSAVSNNVLGSGAIRLGGGTTLNLRDDGFGAPLGAGPSAQWLLAGYNNPVVVGGDLTISLANAGASSNKTFPMGPLTIGPNTLTVNTANGYAINFGATTLDGNATFNLGANNPTVTLGQLTYGGIRNLTKSGGGELRVLGTASGAAAGSTWNVTTGTLTAVGPGALGGSNDTILMNAANNLGGTGTLRLASDGVTSLGPETIVHGDNVMFLPGAANQAITVDRLGLSGYASWKTMQMGNLTIGSQLLQVNDNAGNGLEFTSATLTGSPIFAPNGYGPNASGNVPGLKLSNVASGAGAPAANGAVILTVGANANLNVGWNVNAGGGGLLLSGSNPDLGGVGGATGQVLDVVYGMLAADSDAALGNLSNAIRLSTDDNTRGFRAIDNIATSRTFILNTANNAIEVVQSKTLTLNAPFAYPVAGYNLNKRNDGTLELAADNSGWNGTLTVDSGAVKASNPGALGSGGWTVVSNIIGAAVQLNGVTLGKQFNISNSGINTGGALQAVGGGASTLTGMVYLSNAATIGADAGSTLNLNGGLNANGQSLTFAGAGAINLNSPFPTQTNYQANTVYSITKIGSGTLSITADNSADCFAYNGNIGNGMASFNVNAGTVVFSGAGRLPKLQGDVRDDYSFSVINPGGAITLDNSVTALANRLSLAPNSKIANTTTTFSTPLMKVAGGTINFLGNSAAPVNEAAGRLWLYAGMTQINTSGAGVLSFDGLNRNAQSALHITRTGTSSLRFTGTVPTLYGGILPAAYVGNDFATVGGLNQAVVATTYSSGAISLESGTYYGNGGGLTAYFGTPGGNVKLAGDQANVVTRTVNALKLTGNSPANVAINAGQSLYLASGGLIYDAASGGSINGGYLSATPLFNEVMINNATDLTVGSVIADNRAFWNIGGSNFMKTGAGNLTLTSPATYSGTTVVNQGTLTLAAGDNTLLPGRTLVVGRGATVDLAAASQYVGSIGWAPDNNNLSVGGVEGSAGVIRGNGGTFTTNGTSWYFSGQFQGTMNLVKTGGNTMTLNSVSTNSGNVLVNGGGLTLQDGATMLSVAANGFNVRNAALTINNQGTKDLPDRINDAAPITLDSAWLQFNGRQQSNSAETVGAVTANTGLSTIWVQNDNNNVSSAQLTMSSLTRNAGATVFVYGRNPADANNPYYFGQLGNNPRLAVTNTLTGNVAPINGVVPGLVNYDYNGGNRYVDLVGYTPGVGFGSLGQAGFPAYSVQSSLANSSATDSYKTTINTAEAVRPGGQTVNALVLQGNNGNQNVTFSAAGDVLTLASGMLLRHNEQTNTLGATAGSGVLTSGNTASKELSITNVRGSLRINSVIADSASVPHVQAVLTSNVPNLGGNIVLLGANTYTGGTVVNGNGGTAVYLQGSGVTVPAAADPLAGLVINNTTVNANQGNIAAANVVTLNGGGVLALNGSNTLAGLVFNNQGGGNPSVSITGTNSLTLPAGGNIAVASTNVNNYAWIGPSSGTAYLDLGGSSAHDVSVDAFAAAPYQTAMQIDAVIQNGGFTKKGAGVLTLTQANAFSGGLTIQGGAVLANNKLAIGSAGSTITLDGGGLWLGTGDTSAQPYRVIAANTNSLAVTVNGGTLASTGYQQNYENCLGTGTNTLGGPLTVNLGDALRNVAGSDNTYQYNSADRNLYLTGKVTGSGALTILGSRGNINAAKALILNNASNDFTGPITAGVGGVLSVNSIANGGVASAMGAGGSAAANLVFDGGGLKYTGSSAGTTDRLFTLGVNGGVIDSSSSGNSALTFSSPGAIAFTADAGPRSLALQGTSTAANTFTPVIGDKDPATGKTSVLKYGGVTQNDKFQGGPFNPGTWILGGMNTYTGPTGVYAGTLKAGSPQAFGINSAVSLANNSAGANLDLNGFDLAIGSLTGGGASGGNVLIGANTLTIGGDNTTPAAFAGAIVGNSGAGSVVKVGSGTLTLSGSNTYGGDTVISAGTLALAGYANNISASSSVHIAGGAALNVTALSGGTMVLGPSQTVVAKGSGTASILGSLDAGAGTIDLQDAANLGTLALSGGLAVNSGALLKFDLGTSGSDRIAIGSSAALTGTTMIDVGALTGATGLLTGPQAYTLITAAGGLNSGYFTLSNATLPVNGVTYTLSLSGDATHQWLGVSLGGVTTPGTIAIAAASGNPAAVRVGVASTLSVHVGNVATAGSNSLNYTLSGAINGGPYARAAGDANAAAGDTRSGSYTASSSGAKVLTVTATDGAASNSPQSTGINLTAYNLAAATGVTSTLNFAGPYHQGAVVPTQAVSVTNGAAADGYSEKLNATLTAPAGLSGSGAISGLTAGSTAGSALQVGVDTSVLGAINGTVTVNLTSDGAGTSGLGLYALAAKTVAVTGGYVYSGKSSWHTASGDWGVHGNWVETVGGGPGGAPGTAGFSGDTATFGGSTSATVSLNGANPSVAGVTFNASGGAQYQVVKGSSGALTLDNGSNAATITASTAGHTISAPLVLASNAAVSVTNSGHTLTLSGPISGSGKSLTKSGPGTLRLDSAGGPGNSYTGGTTVNGGAVVLAHADALPLNKNLTIGTGATVREDGNLGNAVQVGGLSISGTGTFDLSGGKLVVDGTVTAESVVRSYIVAGRNGGTWDGTGITSSWASANPVAYAVGYMSNSDLVPEWAYTVGTNPGAPLHMVRPFGDHGLGLRPPDLRRRCRHDGRSDRRRFRPLEVCLCRRTPRLVQRRLRLQRHGGG